MGSLCLGLADQRAVCDAYGAHLRKSTAAMLQGILWLRHAGRQQRMSSHTCCRSRQPVDRSQWSWAAAQPEHQLQLLRNIAGVQMYCQEAAYQVLHPGQQVLWIILWPSCASMLAGNAAAQGCTAVHGTARHSTAAALRLSCYLLGGRQAP